MSAAWLSSYPMLLVCMALDFIMVSPCSILEEGACMSMNSFELTTLSYISSICSAFCYSSGPSVPARHLKSDFYGAKFMDCD